MFVTQQLNELAKLALIASDASYFTPTNTVPLGGALAPFRDTPTYDIVPLYAIAAGFVKNSDDARSSNDAVGFKFSGYRSVSTNEIIVAFGGTDGPDPVDWTSNTQLGWNQWETSRNLVFDYLRPLVDAGTKVHFTGQSLGGALAQYAAYEWVQTKLTTTNPLDPEFLADFNRQNVSLTTFNGIGGLKGLTDHVTYDATVLQGLGLSGHFYVTNDLVSRLGGGHVGGDTFLLDFKSGNINPFTGLPYAYGLVDAHRIETGFYANLRPGALLEFQVAGARPVDYLNVDSVQEVAALFGNLLNNKSLGLVESRFRLVAAITAGLTIGSVNSVNTMTQALITSLHDSGDLSDSWFQKFNGVNWGAIFIPARPVTGAISILSTLGAVFTDAVQGAATGISTIFQAIGDYVGAGSRPDVTVTPPAAIDASSRQLQFEVLMASLGADPQLAELTASLPAGLDPEALAAQMLSGGADWLPTTLAMARAHANTAGQTPSQLAEMTTQLVTALNHRIDALQDVPVAEKDQLVAQFNTFTQDTAQGFAKAYSEFVQGVAGSFDLGRVLSFLDINLIDQAYAAELSDPWLSSSVRSVVEQAQDIVQRAGQTVVVQQGIGANPFNTAGFDPAIAPLAMGTVKEKSVNTFTAYLPFEAGTGGQAVQLKLNGVSGNTVTVLSGGQELTPVNGLVTLVVREGQKEIQFALRAQSLSVDVTVALVAQLVDGTGVATHFEDHEATITAVNTPAINYANGFPSQVYIGTEFDDLRDLLGSFNYEAHGNGGNDLIFSRFGHDQLYGEVGHDSLFGFLGHDQLYGGAGRDLLIADWRDDYVPPFGEVAGQDVVDGGDEDDVVAGGGGDDQLIGGTGNDHLWGDNLVEGDGANPGDPGSGLRGTYFFRVANTPGDDELDGGDGDDLLLGNLGNDVLLGGAGADTLFGDQVPEDSGAPVAFLTVSGGADFLDGGDGNDLLQGDGGDDVLWGGDGHDQLYGDDRIAGAVTPGDDWLESGAGDDLLVGGAGSDLLDGGADNDQLFGEEGDDVLDGGDGIDQLSGGIGNDDLYGGAGNDVLAGHEGADTLLGEAGADQLDGGNDNDDLYGGTGNDVLFGQTGDDYLDGEEDDDELQGGAGNDILVGNIGNDRLFGDMGNDTLWGDDGDDLLDGGEGANLLLGGDGNDQLLGGSGVDELDGGVGNDVLTGGAGADTFIFTAGSGQDTIVDGTAEDRVLTELRSDEVTVARSGNNLVLFVPGTTNQLTMKNFFLTPAQQLGAVQFGDGVVQNGTALIDRARSVIGTAAGETLIGPVGLDGILVGLGGDDALFGQDGDDLLDGGTGTDHLEGSAGNDTYVFGRGYGIDTIQEDDFLGTNIDTVQFLAGVRPEDVTVRGVRLEDSYTRDLSLVINGTANEVRVTGFFDDPAYQIDQITFADGTVWDSATIQSKFEAEGFHLITSSSEGVELFGTQYRDTITGGAGNDYLEGFQGDDVLRGEGGHDDLIGSQGNDVLYGGAGDDYLGGAEDADQMIGGAGNDRYGVGEVGDVVIELPGEGSDTVEVEGLTEYTLPDHIEVLRLTLNGQVPVLRGTGNSLDNLLKGNFYDNVLEGLEGNDTLWGGERNQFVGPNADELRGGTGDDTYYFEAFNGTATIDDVSTAGGLNALRFGASIRPSDLAFIVSGGQLTIAVPTTGDQVILAGFDPTNQAGSLVTGRVEFTGNQDQVVSDFHIALEELLDQTLGTETDDVLSGTSGVDAIKAGAGDDQIIGGAGNDILMGGAGNDTYLWNIGDGIDLIDDHHALGDVNRVVFGAGIDPGAVGLESQGGGGAFTVRVGNEGLQLLDAFASIDAFQFADGTTLTFQDLLARGVDVVGTNRVPFGGIEYLSGTSVDDRILGLGGQDDIYGGEGNDTLTGGTGDDFLRGGAGVDTYVFRLGDGFDQIEDEAEFVDTGDGGRIIDNRILFGAGITLADLTFVEMNLTIRKILVGSNGEGLLLPNFVDFLPGVSTISFVDGLTLDIYQLRDAGLITQDQFIQGDPGGGVLIGGSGNDVIQAEGGDAALIGGAGNDTLRGGPAVLARFVGGPGNDVFFASSGTNTFIMSLGSGRDSIQIPNYLTSIPSSTVQFGGAYSTFNPSLGIGSLVIRYGTLGDEVHILDFDPNDVFSRPAIQSFAFTDRTLTYEDLIALGFDIHGTSGADVLIGTNTTDRLLGLAGNDDLSGGDGADTFTGGQGSDTVRGGSGHDTYIFNRGDGIDTLHDVAVTGEGNRIQFGTGITLSALTFTRDEAARTLTIQVGSSGTDQLRLLNFDPTGANGSFVVETLAFADGSTVNLADLFPPIVNHAPTVATPLADQTVPEDAPFTIQVAANTFADQDAGDVLTLSASLADGSALPAWLSFDAASATFSGTPDDAQVGSLDLKVTATDRENLNVSDVFTLTVNNVNETPTVAVPLANQTALEDTAFTFAVPGSTFADVDPGDVLTYSTALADGTSVPSWLSFDPSTRTFSGTPLNSHVGTLALTVTATDQGNLSVSTGFTVAIQNVNDAPTVASPLADQTVQEDAPFTIQLPANTFADQDAGDVLTLSASLADGTALPSWLSFNPTTRTFSGTPNDAQVGTLDLHVMATDTGNLSVSDSVTLTVNNVNEAPTVAVPLADQQATEDAPFSVVAPAGTFADVDSGDTFTYSATLANGAALPPWLSFNPVTRTLSGTPLNGNVGTLAIAVTATDTGNLSASDTFSLTVTNVNDAPTVATPLADLRATEDTAFSFTVHESTVTDIDQMHGDRLTYRASLSGGGSLPIWLSFDPLTRTFSGTPGNADVGSLALMVTATDQGKLSASTGFTLAVQNVNDTPTVAAPMADQIAAEDEAFTLVVPGTTFADEDVMHGDVLIYRATLADGNPLPAWLNFNPTTRTFSGTPGAGEAGTVQIAITATDTGHLSATNTFALVISGPLPKTLVGTAENDVLTGGRGDDTFTGLAGNDTLTGGQGDDWLDGGAGTDTMQGGIGNDTYVVNVTGDVVTELANEGTDTVQSSLTYLLGAQVEHLTLTGTTTINGTGNVLDNTLLGNSANNTLNGGAGSDHLNGGLGNDTMIGGAGHDTYVVNQAGDVVIESVNQGTDTVESSITFTLGSNVENLTLMGTANLNGNGSSANNVLIGNSGNNTLDGGSGNDVIDGGDGNDSLLGGSGDDTLLGGLGIDTLTAGSGNDILNGGDGGDMLDGGSGDDQLLGGAGNDALTGGSGADQLTGGSGHDTMTGGSGHDTFVVGRGEGQDLVQDDGGAADRLRYDTGITPLDLIISRQVNDLRIALHGGTDQVTIQNWYTSPTTNQIETIQAGNGQTLLHTQVDQLIQAMAGFTAQTGLTWDQAIDQQPQEVQTVLAASWQ